MTAYQLMVRRQKYIPIDIRKHSQFIIDSNLKQEHLATLREIDLLTTQFSNKEFLKSLFDEGLISKDDLEKKISIRYSKNGKIETLSNSMLFKEAKDYLDINTLENVLKILSSDEQFVRSLIEEYLPKDDGIYNTREYINLYTIQALEATINNNVNYYRLKSFLVPYRNIINGNIINNLYHCNANDITAALVKIFYYNEIYSRKYIRDNHYNQCYGDYNDYYSFNKEKIQYKRLHDLAKFTYTYDKKRQQLEEEPEYQEEFLEPGELTFKEEPVITPTVNKPKKRIKKPLEGQTSFF